MRSTFARLKISSFFACISFAYFAYFLRNEELLPEVISLDDFNIERSVEPYKPLRLKDDD